MKSPIVGILLAAGAGSRFGGRKLLQPLSDGVPVGLASLRNLKAVVDEVIVVVRAGDEELHALLKSEASAVVVSQLAWRGMGHSLADAVFASSPAVGWVVALGDMPRISPTTIRAVIQTLQVHARIVLPVHNGERGHPVAFPAALRESLQGLSGDAGARDIIRMNPDLVVRLELSDPGILRDVDTPADLTAINQYRP